MPIVFFQTSLNCFFSQTNGNKHKDSSFTVENDQKSSKSRHLSSWNQLINFLSTDQSINDCRSTQTPNQSRQAVCDTWAQNAETRGGVLTIGEPAGSVTHTCRAPTEPVKPFLLWLMSSRWDSYQNLSSSVTTSCSGLNLSAHVIV